MGISASIGVVGIVTLVLLGGSLISAVFMLGSNRAVPIFLFCFVAGVIGVVATATLGIIKFILGG